MKLSYKRSDRLGDLIRTEISDIIFRKIKDPRVRLITITGVDVSDDLRAAKIYFSVIGSDQERRGAASGLESAKGFIRKLLGSRLDLRYVPDIDFVHDQSFEYGEKIDKLLKKIKEEQKNDSN